MIRILFLFVLAFSPLRLAAQDIPVEQIVLSLSPERTGPIVSNAGAELTRGIKRHEPIPEVFDLPKMQIMVAFEGETHRLTVGGMLALRSVAAAMLDPRLAEGSFQIGSHAYLPQNLTASQPLTTRRAQSIVDHLTTFYGVPAETLVPVGYGATAPFDVAQTSHPMNQRIELINLSPLNR